MSYAESSAALTCLKRDSKYQWLNEVSAVALQQTLRDLQRAFVAFFEKRSAYPVFRKKESRASARFTRQGFNLINRHKLLIHKLGIIKIRWDRPLPVQPSTVIIIRESDGRYYASFVVDVEIQELEKTGLSVGLDFGASRLATLSTGEHVANPRHLRKKASRVATLQRRLQRKTMGSNRRERARIALAREHMKIVNARRDTLHKFTTDIVRRFDFIAIEDLNVRGIVKGRFGRGIRDVGIGVAICMLKKKAEGRGKTVVQVDRFFPSSKMCSSCGYINTLLTLSDRTWTCPSCGADHDRDLNAAKNILAVGQTVAAHGDGVRAA